MSLHSTKQASIELKILLEKEQRRGEVGRTWLKEISWQVQEIPCTKKTSYATTSKLMG